MNYHGFKSKFQSAWEANIVFKSLQCSHRGEGGDIAASRVK